MRGGRSDAGRRVARPAAVRSLTARVAIAFLALQLAAGAGPASALQTKAPRALVVALDSTSVLASTGHEEAFAPGNLAKLVTAAVVAEAIAAGETTPDTRFAVSEHAWRTGGAPARVTTMFAAVRSQVAVADLMRGLVVHYANDAAIVLAEGIAGGEAAFAERMNALCERLGMAGSHFANPTGFPDRAARTTLSDMERLVRWMRAEHPDLLALYAVDAFTWNKITQRNKTDAIRDVPGVVGLSLAYEESAGFGGVLLAVRGERAVFIGLSGLPREEDRRREIAVLVGAVFDGYRTVEVYGAGERVGTVRLHGGAEDQVAVASDAAVRVTVPIDEAEAIFARIVYEGPVPAPVRRGQPVGELEIGAGGQVLRRVPLVAADDVPLAGLSKRAGDGVRELMFGWW